MSKEFAPLYAKSASEITDMQWMQTHEQGDIETLDPGREL